MRVFCTTVGLVVLFIAAAGLLFASTLSDSGERMTGFVGAAAGALVGNGLMLGAVAFRPSPQPPRPFLPPPPPPGQFPPPGYGQPQFPPAQ